jgi:hypothetical protein
MAIGQRPITKPAPGNAPNTGSPGFTPAPKYQTPDLEEVRVFTPGYGTNNDGGPSSVAPGKTRTSGLADELKRFAQNDGELDRVISEGTARRDDSITGQLRAIADKKVPTHPHMSGASAGPKVPAKLGMSEAPPVRKPV